jgi:hypothetical protein
VPSRADSIHQFLAHFVLIEYDFMHEGATSLAAALNAIQACMATGQTGQSPAVWTKLCRLAREGAGRSAVFDRPDGQAAIARQRAFIELGTLRARHLDQEIKIRQLSPDTVEIVDQFVSDGVLQNVQRGHTPLLP